jgi:hypothetical protein
VVHTFNDIFIQICVSSNVNIHDAVTLCIILHFYILLVGTECICIKSIELS